MLTEDEAITLRRLIQNKIRAELLWATTNFDSRDNEIRWKGLQTTTIALDKFIVELTEKE